MCSHSFQGSFKVAEMDPTLLRPHLTTLQRDMQAVTGVCRVLLGEFAWKDRQVLWCDGKRNALDHLGREKSSFARESGYRCKDAVQF